MDFLSVKEFLNFKANIYHTSAESYKKAFDKWKTLFREDNSIYSKLIKDLSTGNKQKVGIISSIIMTPKLLMLDEPFNYLDPTSQVDVMKLLQNLNKEEGTTILLSSHNLEYISEISSRVILLENGSIMSDFEKSRGDVVASLKDYFYSCSQEI